MTIGDIVGAISSGCVRVTDHADEEATADGLKLQDVFSSAAHGEIIEEYPADVPYPSCLVLGWAPGGSPVHSVRAYNRDSRWAVLVTVYRPDPARWVDWRRRRKSE
ncbi:MAG: DUF4258 domain-containing protein [Acidobacteriia bacterium]|nr:DUF4258 domain-containing protein [Terriglobia bacterium]